MERMEEAATEVGLRVRYENISRPGYPGGLCRIKDRWVVILNKGAPVEERLTTLASAIASQDTEDVFLPPDVREEVEKARARTPPSPEPLSGEEEK